MRKLTKKQHRARAASKLKPSYKDMAALMKWRRARLALGKPTTGKVVVK